MTPTKSGGGSKGLKTVLSASAGAVVSTALTDQLQTFAVAPNMTRSERKQNRRARLAARRAYIERQYANRFEQRFYEFVGYLEDRISQRKQRHVYFDHFAQTLYVDEKKFAGKSFWYFPPTHSFRRGAIMLLTDYWYVKISIVFIAIHSFSALAQQPEVFRVAFDNDDALSFLLVIDRMLLLFFAIEVAMQTLAVTGVRVLKSPFRMIDVIVVAVSVMLDLFPKQSPAVPWLVALNALRPLRVVQRIHGMRQLMLVIVSCLPTIGSVVVLLLVILFVFSLIGVTLFAGSLHHYCSGQDLPDKVVYVCSSGYLGKEDDWAQLPCVMGNCTWQSSPKHPWANFDNIGFGVFAIIRIITLDAWIDIANDVMNGFSPVAMLFFLILTIIGSYWAMNLILAVITDGFSRFFMDQKLEREALERAKSTGGEVQVQHGVSKALTGDETLPASHDTNNAAADGTAVPAITASGPSKAKNRASDRGSQRDAGDGKDAGEKPLHRSVKGTNPMVKLEWQHWVSALSRASATSLRNGLDSVDVPDLERDLTDMILVNDWRKPAAMRALSDREKKEFGLTASNLRMASHVGPAAAASPGTNKAPSNSSIAAVVASPAPAPDDFVPGFDDSDLVEMAKMVGDDSSSDSENARQPRGAGGSHKANLHPLLVGVPGESGVEEKIAAIAKWNDGVSDSLSTLSDHRQVVPRNIDDEEVYEPLLCVPDIPSTFAGRIYDHPGFKKGNGLFDRYDRAACAEIEQARAAAAASQSDAKRLAEKKLGRSIYRGHRKRVTDAAKKALSAAQSAINVVEEAGMTVKALTIPQLIQHIHASAWFDVAVTILIVANVLILVTEYFGMATWHSTMINVTSAVVDAIVLLNGIVSLVLTGPFKYFRHFRKTLAGFLDGFVEILCAMDLTVVVIGGVSYLRVFRIFRVVKVLKKFRIFNDLINTIRSSLYYFVNCLVLLIIVMLVFVLAARTIFANVVPEVQGCDVNPTDVGCNAIENCVYVTRDEWRDSPNPEEFKTRQFMPQIMAKNLTGIQQLNLAAAINRTMLSNRSLAFDVVLQELTQYYEEGENFRRTSTMTKTATTTTTATRTFIFTTSANGTSPFSATSTLSPPSLNDGLLFVERPLTTLDALPNRTTVDAIVDYFALLDTGNYSCRQYRAWLEIGGPDRLNFNSLSVSFLTVFTVVTRDDWSKVMYAVMNTNPASAAFFVILIGLGSYCLLPLLVAVLLVNFGKTEKTHAAETADEASTKIDEEERKRGLRESVRNPSDSNALFEGDSGGGGGETADAKERRERTLAAASEAGAFAAGVTSAGVTTWREEPPDVIAKDESLKGMQKQMRRFLRYICEVPDQTVEVDHLVGHSLFIFRPTNKLRLYCADVFSGRFFPFERFVFVISSLHCMLVILATTLPDGEHPSLLVLDWILTVLQLMDMLIRLIVQGAFLGKENYWRHNAANKVDFVGVVASLLSTVLWTISTSGPARRVSLGLKALKPTRVMIRSRAMRNVIKAVGLSAPDMLNFLAVAGVLFVMAAVVCVSLFAGRLRLCSDGSDRSERECIGSYVIRAPTDVVLPGNATVAYHSRRFANFRAFHFDDVFSSFVTLFQCSLGTEWTDVLFAVSDAPDTAGFGPVRRTRLTVVVTFIFWIFTGNFVVLNIFVGTVVDSFTKLKLQMSGSLFLTEEQSEIAHIRKLLHQTQAKKVLNLGLEPFLNRRMNQLCFALVSKPLFQNVNRFVLLLNIVVIGLQHYRQQLVWDTVQRWTTIIIAVFLIIEMMVKVGVAGPKTYLGLGYHRLEMAVAAQAMVEVAVAEIGVDVPWLKALRVLRVMRLVREQRGFRRLVHTGFRSLPAMWNVGSLLFLVFFMSAITCMAIFADVRTVSKSVDGYLFDHNLNFANFARSMITLYSVATFDVWSAVIQTGGTKEPFCVDGVDCGSGAGTRVFLTLFVLCVGLVMINLFITVVLENFSESVLLPTYMKERMQDVNLFRRAWVTFDPMGRQVIHASQFVPLLRSLPGPRRRLLQLKGQIPDQQDKGEDRESQSSWTPEEMEYYAAHCAIGLGGESVASTIPTLRQLTVPVTFPRQEVLFADAIDAIGEKIFHVKLIDSKTNAVHRKAKEKAREYQGDFQIVDYYCATVIQAAFREYSRFKRDPNGRGGRKAFGRWNAVLAPILQQVWAHGAAGVFGDESAEDAAKLRRLTRGRKRKDAGGRKGEEDDDDGPASPTTEKSDPATPGGKHIRQKMSIADALKNKMMAIDDLVEDTSWMNAIEDTYSLDDDDPDEQFEEELPGEDFWLTAADRRRRQEWNLRRAKERRAQLASGQFFSQAEAFAASSKAAEAAGEFQVDRLITLNELLQRRKRFKDFDARLNDKGKSVAACVPDALRRRWRPLPMPPEHELLPLPPHIAARNAQGIPINAAANSVNGGSPSGSSRARAPRPSFQVRQTPGSERMMGAAAAALMTPNVFSGGSSDMGGSPHRGRAMSGPRTQDGLDDAFGGMAVLPNADVNFHAASPPDSALRMPSLKEIIEKRAKTFTKASVVGVIEGGPSSGLSIMLQARDLLMSPTPPAALFPGIPVPEPHRSQSFSNSSSGSAMMGNGPMTGPEIAAAAAQQAASDPSAHTRRPNRPGRQRIKFVVAPEEPESVRSSMVRGASVKPDASDL